MIREIDSSIYAGDIISLWTRCFGDDERYVLFFLKNCPHRCIAYFDNSRVVSMLFLLDGRIDSYAVKYIYAACTDEEYRQKGLMGHLIEYCKDLCSKEKLSGIFIVPANETLYDYYSKFDFIDAFKKKYVLYSSKSLIYNDAEIEYTTDIERAVLCRNNLLSNYNAFVLSDEVSKYSVADHIESGGRIIQNNNYIAFIYEKDKDIVIKEIICTDNNQILNLCENFIKNGYENIYISQPIVYNGTDKMDTCAKCGMCYPITDDFKKYINGKIFYAGMFLD